MITIYGAANRYVASFLRPTALTRIRHHAAWAGAVAVLAAFSLGTTASADQVNGSINVSLTLKPTCSIGSPTTLDFGTLSVGAGTGAANGAKVGSASAISVTCSNTSPYNVGLLPGNADTAGAGVLTGTASGNTASTISYQLHASADGSGTAFGDIAASGGGVGNGQAGTGTGTAQTIAVSAVITGDTTTKIPDTYTDTVAVHISF